MIKRIIEAIKREIETIKMEKEMEEYKEELCEECNDGTKIGECKVIHHGLKLIGWKLK